MKKISKQCKCGAVICVGYPDSSYVNMMKIDNNYVVKCCNCGNNIDFKEELNKKVYVHITVE